jgi:hypothetical protein
MHFDSPNDLVVPAQLTASITVSWSKPRCWHGDRVTIRVRTQRVIDGSLLRVQIFVHGAGNHFDQIHPNPTITNNAANIDYTLDWQTKLNPPYPTQVDVKATLFVLGIDALSDPMDIDLIPPLHSA